MLKNKADEMSLIINGEDVEKISEILGAKPEIFDDSWTWKIVKQQGAKPLVLALNTNVDLGGGNNGTLVTVQTQHGYYELHGPESYMYFEPDEVIFISYNADTLSCLIVGKEASCSLFSNIRREILNTDFAELHPAVLLAAMQLSITESMLM